MLENCKSALERWGGVSDIIDRWLHERQEVLVVYCQLSELIDEDPLATEETLQHLCQLLVDYVSAGHFEIYDKLAQEGREYGDQSALAEAKTLFEELDKTTEYVLDFNDKYQETDDTDSLNHDLSKLGEVLANRFEGEDRAIAMLHTAHKDKVMLASQRSH